MVEEIPNSYSEALYYDMLCSSYVVLFKTFI